MNRTAIPTTNDLRYMSQAIKLAQKGRFTTTPNPNVGCVIVKNNKVIGQGFHQKAGTPHAEVHALAELTTEQTSGATAYVTLEPCSHFGRTPPCAQALIDAKLACVVIAMQDPNPQVAGQGIAMLEQAGIQTIVGVLENEARALNPGFLKQMESKLPYVQLKLASSIDGKTALGNGQSKWITGASARADVQTHRAMSCAILSSAFSVITDDARLDVRKDEINVAYLQSDIVNTTRQPAKIILDGANRITAELAPSLALFKTANSKVILIKAPEDELKAKQAFEGIQEQLNAKVEITSVGYTNGAFDLTTVLSQCYSWQINHLWIETGAKLSASFINAKLVDELILYMAPKIMGAGAQELLPLGPFKKMTECIDLALHDTRMLDKDIKFRFTCG
jgi:diaminohydroxyphosphoribosylaminopyrimidine deaminase / 5-amino-6-(5-phosphoribosylamino)uracil reductase